MAWLPADGMPLGRRRRAIVWPAGTIDGACTVADDPVRGTIAMLIGPIEVWPGHSLAHWRR